MSGNVKRKYLFSVQVGNSRAPQDLISFLSREYSIQQIKVSNSALISAFMTELEPDTPVTQCDFDRLQLSTNPYLERNVEFLIECVDDLSME
nr:translation initiation factor 3 subunit H1 [Ipomoea batatas]